LIRQVLQNVPVALDPKTPKPHQNVNIRNKKILNPQASAKKEKKE